MKRWHLVSKMSCWPTGVFKCWSSLAQRRNIPVYASCINIGIPLAKNHKNNPLQLRVCAELAANEKVVCQLPSLVLILSVILLLHYFKIANQYGLTNPQMYYLVHNISCSMVVTFFFGAVIHMARTKDDYFRKNMASTFESQYLARRHLTDTVTLNGIKGGAKFALKYGTFSSLYLLCTTTAANYNNKVTIYEHIGSGALLGALIRFRFGLKGMAAAACLGGFLGAIAGGSVLTYMWLADIKFEDIIANQYDNYYTMRKDKPARSY